MLWYNLFLLLILSWLIGKMHMRLVPEEEHGRLNEKRLKVRIWSSSTPFVAIWTLFYVMYSKGIIKSQPQLFIENLSILLSAALMYWFFNSVLSSIEVYWYQGEHLNLKNDDGSEKVFLRKKVFYWTVLPILFSAPYLYWVLMIPAWVMIIYIFQKSLW